MQYLIIVLTLTYQKDKTEKPTPSIIIKQSIANNQMLNEGEYLAMKKRKALKLQ